MTDVLVAILADPIGRWFLYFGVTIFFVVLAGFVFLSVRKRLGQIGDDLGLVKHEVKNNHTTNLREEADERHAENTKLNRDNAKKLDMVLTAVQLLRQDVSTLFASDQQHDADIRRIEDTIDRRPQ